MKEKKTTPALYGITNSNRDFSNQYYWGKNQFNSSFPAALCCYMRDRGMKAVYVSSRNGRTELGEKDFDFVFGTSLPNDKLKFMFEDSFEPYKQYVQDSLEKIDLVIMDNSTGQFIRPLEIKLTTLPDDGTSSLDEGSYGSELVVRSPTMRYLALSIASMSAQEDKEKILAIFKPVCGMIRDWDNTMEMLSRKEKIFKALNRFFKEFERLQTPLLLQPVWKTIGKQPRLADNCLDVFVWSSFALARLFMDSCNDGAENNKITRQQRAALRLARFLYEFSKAGDGKVFQQPIYDGMTFNTLNDKEFAVSGTKTNPYMKCERLMRPAIRKEEIKKIVLGGGQKLLSPERRFDSILFFSKELFDE